jgi:hypothetical protein
MTTYIKNKGVVQTFFEDGKHHKKENEVKWNADYNGNRAKINVNVKDNGKKHKYQYKLNNSDLAKLLSIPATKQPVEQRLEQDFLHIKRPELHSELGNPILFKMNPYSSGMNIDELSDIPELMPAVMPELPELPELPALDYIPSNIELYNPKLTQREKRKRIYTPSPKTIYTKKVYNKARGIHPKKVQTKKNIKKSIKKSIKKNTKKNKIPRFIRKLF